MSIDQFYLPREDQLRLLDLLREIPAIVDDLAITLTRQDRLGSNGPQVSTGWREQPMPINLNAVDVADELHNTLTGWIRLVCEERGLRFPWRLSTLEAARWLDRNMVSLAMSPGAEEALYEIQEAVRRARRATDSRPRKTVEGDLHEATGAELNAAAIARLRIELDDRYANLTERRIKTLKDRGMITAVRTVPNPSGPPIDVFDLGDVLVAHLLLPTRRRKSTA